MDSSLGKRGPRPRRPLGLRYDDGERFITALEWSASAGDMTHVAANRAALLALEVRLAEKARRTEELLERCRALLQTAEGGRPGPF